MFTGGLGVGKLVPPNCCKELKTNYQAPVGVSFIKKS